MLFRQQRYAAVSAYMAIIITLSYKLSNAYLLLQSSFVKSKDKLSLQHSNYYNTNHCRTTWSICVTLQSQSKCPFQTSDLPKLVRFAVTKENDDTDDGWKTTNSPAPTDEQQNLSPDFSSQLPKEESPSKLSLSPEQELESLRMQMAEKRNLKSKRTPSYATDNSKARYDRVSADNEQERDLFIPILSILSLAGLFGAYGYESLRLYMNGELYLPWNQ